jgi:hypothetical protein
VRPKQLAAVAISVAIVLAAYLAWMTAAGRFNPSPTTVTIDTTSCAPTEPPCPAFRIDSANLTVRKLQDIVSQSLEIRISALGPTELSRLGLFFDGFPVGNLTMTVLPGHYANAAWAIPTTINVSQGDNYSILVEGTYLTAKATPSARYWCSTSATAS